ncbi:MAG: FkbM family methyltransferase [Acetobacteraceae bacterium]|nr:FkbM family methyltransferase [Acetobacteraceae bacterium]
MVDRARSRPPGAAGDRRPADPTRGAPRALARASGVLRSLCLYHGVPGRSARLRRFYRQFVGPGDLCFDVGAHAGDRTRALARLGARVVAVEPQPDFAALLRVLFRRNPAVTVVGEAVAAVPGELPLFVSSRTPTVTTASGEWLRAVARTAPFAGVRWDRTCSVRATTLDRLIARHGRPRFCKIDVEGFEADVLRGLSVPVEVLSVEVIPAAVDVALACVDRLMELGPYRFNTSLGESLRLCSGEWIDADRLRAWLKHRPPAASPGDIYARLRTSAG